VPLLNRFVAFALTAPVSRPYLCRAEAKSWTAAAEVLARPPRKGRRASQGRLSRSASAYGWSLTLNAVPLLNRFVAFALTAPVSRPLRVHSILLRVHHELIPARWPL